MQDKFILMYRDEPVITFDKGFEAHVLNASRLPWGLRDDASPIALYRWLTGRAAPLTRKNVDYMYMLLGLPRSVSGQTDIVRQYGGVSVNDFFWIKQAERYPEAYATMKTFDYIVGNPDRHPLNWGWTTDENLQPTGLTPMFDFNFALQSINMELPAQIDKALAAAAKEFLATHADTPNSKFYGSRISALAGGAV